MVLGLRTAIYHVSDLKKAKDWYSKAFEVEPYFDEPFYVGFNVGGYELGLNPDIRKTKPGAGGAVPFWGVSDIEKSFQHFITSGASLESPIQDVGGGIKVATLADPFGNLLGLIENPHFKLA